MRLDLNGDGDRTDVWCGPTRALFCGADGITTTLRCRPEPEISRYGTMLIHVEQCFPRISSTTSGLHGGDHLFPPRAGRGSPGPHHELGQSSACSTLQRNFLLVYHCPPGETPDGDYAVGSVALPWTSNADFDGNGKISVFEAFMFARRMNLKDGISVREDDGQPGCITARTPGTCPRAGRVGFGSRTFLRIFPLNEHEFRKECPRQKCRFFRQKAKEG